MFSPHYARARAQGDALPEQFAAINISLCGHKKGWAFVEGPLSPHGRTADMLSLGDSCVTRHADGGIDIDFRGPPTAFDRKIAGQIRLRPRAPASGITSSPRLLDAEGQHLWWPMLPNAEVEVSFTQPNLRFRGRAYHDANAGLEPLSHGFSRWHWMRTLRPEGTEVVYCAEPAAGRAPSVPVAHHFATNGQEHAIVQPAACALPASRWRIGRTAFGDARLLDTVLDAPFYARSRLLVDGRDLAMHESLDLRRWQSPWNQFFMGYRLKRLPGAA